MAIVFGYMYNENGNFVEMIELHEVPIYKKMKKDNWAKEPRKQEEKLCEVHQKNEKGKEECSDCRMSEIIEVDINYPTIEDVQVGYEVAEMPPNCTLEKVPDLNTQPLFKDGKWVKNVEPEPVEPKPQEPSELDRIKQQLEGIQKELESIKNQKPPTIDETETSKAFAAPIQDTPDYEHEINKIKQVIPDLGEQIVDLNSRIADLENKEQV
ncbi:hypothetical protein COF76_22960 [Bacillus wiedmannii]|uniref:hypothetical protein n=1 Tax=Bacillus wiedmannii TaxID=1890302 RepID=UPI000BFE9361|nr:hypothetical protein [Bacillus wiedmannii]PHE94672.1 hypothetical protein COF76_22960 [Bacillus wiedmannii]